MLRGIFSENVYFKMIIQPFEAVFPNLEVISDTQAFFNTAKEKYRFFQEQAFFQAAKQPAFYVYQINRNEMTHCGLIASVSVAEYINEHIKKHEHTLVPKEEKQAILLEERQAVVKPILLVHRSQRTLAEMMQHICIKNSPAFELKIPATKTAHRFWTINQASDIFTIQNIFKNHINTAYIADGHHRFSSIARLYQRAKTVQQKQKYGHVMCALFPGSDLQIHNFNRIIKAFSEKISPLVFLARLSEFAKINPLKKGRIPKKEHEITFFMNGEWFSLEWRKEIISAYANASLPILDVSMLNYCVLEEILLCTDIRNDTRIKYIEGPRGLDALAASTNGRSSVAFCLHPLDWESFFRVIDHGLVLPPKSTWFEPRMLNGLIVQTMTK